MRDHGPLMSMSKNEAPSAARRIVDESLFNFLLELEVQKSRRLQYSVSVVCMDAAVGRNRHPMTPMAERLIRHLRSTDVIFESSPSSLALLLVDAETPSLPVIVNRLADHLRGFVVDTEALVWSAGGSCYPQTAGTAGELLEQARRLMVRARQDGGDRLYTAS